MAKKDLANVTTDLAALAALMPTQRPTVTPSPVSPPTPAPSEDPAPLNVQSEPVPVAATKDKPTPESVQPAEPQAQFSFSLRKSLRKELSRLAADADMTMRAFVLEALKAKGLKVQPDDLIDLRKER
jgi:hypothetical protein